MGIFGGSSVGSVIIEHHQGLGEECRAAGIRRRQGCNSGKPQGMWCHRSQSGWWWREHLKEQADGVNRIVGKQVLESLYLLDSASWS